MMAGGLSPRHHDVLGPPALRCVANPTRPSWLPQPPALQPPASCSAPSSWLFMPSASLSTSTAHSHPSTSPEGPVAAAAAAAAASFSFFSSISFSMMRSSSVIKPSPVTSSSLNFSRMSVSVARCHLRLDEHMHQELDLVHFAALILVELHDRARIEVLLQIFLVELVLLPVQECIGKTPERPPAEDRAKHQP